MVLGYSVNIMKDFGINIMKTIYIMMALVAALTGCASTTTTTKMVKTDEAKPNTVPDWFAADNLYPNSIIVTATDISPDMQFAIDKAMMNARVEMATRIQTKIESLVKESMNENRNTREVNREVERVSKQITNQRLANYTREKLTVVKEPEGYRVFIMLKITLDESRKLISEVRSNKDTASKFKELDDSISKL